MSVGALGCVLIQIKSIQQTSVINACKYNLIDCLLLSVQDKYPMHIQEENKFNNINDTEMEAEEDNCDNDI